MSWTCLSKQTGPVELKVIGFSTNIHILVIHTVYSIKIIINKTLFIIYVFTRESLSKPKGEDFRRTEKQERVH